MARFTITIRVGTVYWHSLIFSDLVVLLPCLAIFALCPCYHSSLSSFAAAAIRSLLLSYTLPLCHIFILALGRHVTLYTVHPTDAHWQTTVALAIHNAYLPQAPLAYQPSSESTSYQLFEPTKLLTSTLATSTLPLTDVPSSSSLIIPHVHPVQSEESGTFQLKSSTNLSRTNISSDALMGRAGRWSVGFLSMFRSYFTLPSIHHHFDHERGNLTEFVHESQRLAPSPSRLDSQSCRWFGICGAVHRSKAGWTWKTPSETAHQKQQQLQESDVLNTPPNLPPFWESGKEDSEQWASAERLQREIPSYVYDYTPYVHLFSGEDFWPCDIADHLLHTTPHQNYTPIANMTNPNLANLNNLNAYGHFTYLQSDDNVEERPFWLGGSSNIPDSLGYIDTVSSHPLEEPSTPDPTEGDWFEVGIGDIKAHGGIRPNPFHPTAAAPVNTRHGEAFVNTQSKQKRERDGGRSSAPAILVVVPKEHGVVDAFWFYFYSYNLGNQVLNVRFGNHVGDWEHSVVRFHHGVPKAVYLSEHNFGEAYSYSAVEKIGKRPVIYSAVGTHAMYATPGLHPYVLPWGLLHDETDRGPLWDPLQNHHAYVYNYTSGILQSSAQTPHAPVNWFHYKAHWGDKFYPLSDPRQYRFAGQYHYVNGPSGPKYKNLGRQQICQGNEKCIIKDWLGNGRTKRWPGLSADIDPEHDSCGNFD